MWNKLLIIAFFLCFPFLGNAEIWLEHSASSIFQNLKEQVQSMVVVQQNDTVIHVKGVEEDERCRKFNVEYVFSISKDKICRNYTFISDANEYWAHRFQDMIDLEEGEGNEKDLLVDGVTLNTQYDFEDFKMTFHLDKEHLVTKYYQVEEE